MPRRSKVELSPETLQELENQFYSFLDSLSHEETKKFFTEFLTTEEKMMMYKRLALYWMLFEGYSLASIQRSLGVTHDTTRLYNKKKNQMSEEFKNILHRIGRTTQAVAPMRDAQTQVEEPQMHEETQTENNTYEEQPQQQEQMEQTNEETHMEAPVEEVMTEPTENETEDYIPAVETHSEEQPQQEQMETTEQQSEQNMEQQEEGQPQMQGEEQAQQAMETEQRETEEEQPLQQQIEQMGSHETTESEAEDEEEKPGEKKKKGFGRFFGF